MTPDEAAVGSMLRLTVCGGGSGGHLFPAIALIQELRRTFPAAQIQFLVSRRPIDASILASVGYPDSGTSVVPYVTLPGARTPLHRAILLPSLLRSFTLAKTVLRRFRPHVVIGCGALASIPGVAAARRLKIPIVLMEQNAVPGTAIRSLARYASLTLAGMPFRAEFATRWPTLLKVTGTPVRSAISALVNHAEFECGKRPRLLILGGSQGSHSVNRLILQALADEQCVPSDWEIVHQTGESQVQQVAAEYARRGRTARVVSFLKDLPGELAGSTIAVSRGGAGTIQELSCAGLPSILVPFRRAAADHQMVNASELASRNAAIVIDEDAADAGLRLRLQLNELIINSALRRALHSGIREFARPDAASEACRLVLLAAADHDSTAPSAAHHN